MREKTSFKPTYIRQWRKHRNLTLEQLQLKLEFLAENLKITTASLSRIERGLQPYTQPTLEALADALMCEPADLLMRDPSQDQMVWSLWDKLGEAQKRQAMRFLVAISEDKAA